MRNLVVSVTVSVALVAASWLVKVPPAPAAPPWAPGEVAACTGSACPSCGLRKNAPGVVAEVPSMPADGLAHDR